MNPIEPLFYIPLVKFSIEKWQTKKKELIDLKEKHEDLFRKDQDDAVQTNFHQDSKVLIEPISNILSEEIKYFLSLMSLKSCSMKDAWYELASKDVFHDIHTHGPVGYSSVCYVEFDKEEHTGTRFVSPFTDFLTGNCLFGEAKVDEGDIIFFPASLMHFTSPNKSNKERLILSFNLVL